MSSQSSHSGADEKKGSDAASGEHPQTRAPVAVVQNSRGVERMEALARAANGPKGRLTLWLIAASVIVAAFVKSIEGSTTWVFDIYASSSYQEHSLGLGALSIATTLMAAVCRPFLAKIADVWTRPNTLIVVLALYTMGFIVAAASKTIGAFVVGSVFTSIGAAGLELMTMILIADLVPLQWRGMAQAVAGFPYFITVWFTGPISTALSTGELWRWGYGMFAIMAPVVLAPAIVCLIILESRAQKTGITTQITTSEERLDAEKFAAENAIKFARGTAIDAALHVEEKTWFQKAWFVLIDIDAFGLILMAFGWSLLLLPFSLAPSAKGTWSNPSMIAMMVLGGVFLIAYALFEVYVSPRPSMPKRLLTNVTFINCIVIDFFYMFAGYFHILYFSSYVYIVTDLSVTNWTIAVNVLTLSLCFFAVIAGIYHRVYHRYKAVQLVGLAVKIIGYGILVTKNTGSTNLTSLIMVQLLVGIGGAFSVIGTQVASQASVPHQDVALAISLLSLYTGIGAASGSAVTTAVWSSLMPKNLRTFLPASVTDAEVALLFADITAVRAYPFDHPVRQGAITAYQHTMYYLWAAATGLSFIPFIAACFQTNYHLGNEQNAVEKLHTDGTRLSPEELAAAKANVPEEPKTKMDKFLAFWNRSY